MKKLLLFATLLVLISEAFAQGSGQGTEQNWSVANSTLTHNEQFGKFHIAEKSNNWQEHDNCTQGDVRLVGGPSNSAGRLEFCYNNSEWGTVCDSGWNRRDSGVVCRQLGFPVSRAGSFFVRGGQFGQGGQPVLNNVNCTGSESRLDTCPARTNGICRNKDVGVLCHRLTGKFFDQRNNYDNIPSADTPFVLFRENKTTFFVSQSGFITFKSSDQATEELMPTIAPLKTSTQNAAHRPYLTQHALTLSRVQELIANTSSSYSDYQPRLALVVTWNIGLYPLKIFGGQRLSTQAVISTDGERSFAILIYGHGDIPSLLRNSSIGFDTGDGVLRFDIRASSLESINIYRIDGLCITKLGHEESCPLQSYPVTCDVDKMMPLSCNCDVGETSPLCQNFQKAVGFINLEVPIRFYRKLEHRLYIFRNGLISFNEELDEVQATQFRRLSRFSVPLIAPLWADYNFRLSGNVNYKVASDNATLAIAEKMIFQHSLSKFSPSLCVVITWVDATLLKDPHGPKLTFQLTLATDGDISYAIFTYENATTAKNILSRDRIVGFHAGDQTRSGTALYDTQQYSSLSDINVFRIDGYCVTTAESACELSLTAMQCGANLTAETCLCGSSLITDTCRLPHFFPFGTESDKEGIDDSVRVMEITKKFIFYNREHTELFVSTSGFITLGGEYSLAEIKSVEAVPYPIIAPLWADYNFREGNIYYRVTNDSEILTAIANRIAEASSHSNYTAFRPTEAVIVTWYQNKILFQDESIETNFQVVLVTDQKVSFAIFLYDEEDVGDITAPSVFSTPDYHGRKKLCSDGGVLERFFRIDGECIVELTNDTCGLDSIPYFCDDIVCQCSINYHAMDSSCIEFLPFGPRVGDSRFLAPDMYNYSEPIDKESTTFPIIPYGMSNTSIIINPHGALRFEYPIQFVMKYEVFSGNYNFNTKSVDYRIVSLEDDKSGVFSKIDFIIKSYNREVKFKSTVALIVTWEYTISNFAFYSRRRQQAVIASDGTAVFVIFQFENMPSNVKYVSQKAAVEISVNDGNNIFRIDGLCITSAASGSMCGLNSVAVNCEELNATNCSCNIGFEPYDTLTCIDIDECDYETSPCEQRCNNTDGSFFCECLDGYTLSSDQRTCEDIDECKSETHCDQRCSNTNGSYYCACWDGYAWSSFKETCEDIDECLDVNECNQQCVPQNGTYTCLCSEGFELGLDNATCEESSSDTSKTATLPLEVLWGLLAPLTLFLFTLFVVYWSYKRKKIRKLLHVADLGVRGSESIEFDSSLLHYKVRSSSQKLFPRSLIIPSCNIKLGKTLGQGEFGVVYKGYLKISGVLETVSATVAVKTVKGFVQKKLVEDLLTECCRMLSFDHPNVLELLGVCLDGGPAPYVIVPFMANGSLSAYLKKERESLFLDLDTAKPDDATAVEKRLLDMCLQIAKGMEYLASKKVIHRDLAARNCMIDVNLLIKVADFGLAESLDSSQEYFRHDTSNAIKLPIKWMAPESIHDSVFSEKSDVWSYGVTCWEVFSAGKTPYPGIHPTDLPKQLDKGLRLEKPLNAACTDEIYTMILKCWDLKVNKRPSFAELVSHFMSDLVTKADYLDLEL